MSKKLILLIMVTTSIGNVGCRDVKVKNETHIHYHKETTTIITGEIDVNNIDSVKQKESTPKKMDNPASAEDKS